MQQMKLFVSYPRTAAAEVRDLAGHLQQLGQDVWLDKELSGGQAWWDTILDRIRTCDCFMFTLCEDALESRACLAELDYANRTDRIVLPVAVGPPVSDQLLPRHLSKLQRVDANDPMQVARALLHLPEARPLPSSLPEPPALPISYLDELADWVQRPELTMTDQHDLLGQLKHRLAQAEDKDAALTLLHRLRRRSDVYAGVAEEIDAELARHAAQADARDAASVAPEVEGSPEPAPPAPPTPPIAPPSGPAYSFPVPPPGRSSSGRKVAAVVVAGLLALGGVGGAIALSAGDEQSPPPHTSGDDDTRPTPPQPIVVSVTPGELPDNYGDDPYLDELAEYCYDGSLVDCDVLWEESPSGSAYEAFGTTCGAVTYLDFAGQCANEFDAELNADAEACDSGDMATCDVLYWDSPVGSLYEAFGAYCGLRSDEALVGSCEVTFSA